MKNFKNFFKPDSLIILLFSILMLFNANQIQAQTKEIPGVLISDAYSDVFDPISGCTDISLCVSIYNVTENPYRTFNDAKIQIILNLSNYQIIDPTPFVNTGLVDPLFGHAIFETTQSNIIQSWIQIIPDQKTVITDFV